jgi:hypothetical protein
MHYAMKFIDLTGASGATYRFRQWPETGEPEHSPVAGNYALISQVCGRVLEIGLLETLGNAKAVLKPESKNAVLFTRLNVPSAVREAEHLDLVASHPHAKVLACSS